MRLDFIPRRELVARLQSGWRLINGHAYRPDDWAILMMLPEEPEPMSADQIHDMARPFLPAFRDVLANRDAAAQSANATKVRKTAAAARRKLETA